MKKQQVTSSRAKVIKRNQKVTKARGETWTLNLIKGRLDAMLKPTALRVLRVRKNISQGIVANRIGVTLSTYGGIERGLRPVKEEKAKVISNFFKEPMSSLFKDHSFKKVIAIRASER